MKPNKAYRLMKMYILRAHAMLLYCHGPIVELLRWKLYRFFFFVASREDIL